MRKIPKTIAIFLLFASCTKELNTSDIITNLTASQSTIDADGSSIVTFSVELNDRAASDRRTIIFSTDGGEWIDGKNGKVSITADYSQGRLLALAKLKAPSTPGTINISAKSSILTINGDFNLITAINAIKVEPKKIFLEPSSFGIGSNFISQDTIVGKITGDNNKNASKGVNVLFEDLLSNGSPALGRFKQLLTSSNSNSIVSAIYSANQLPIGTTISIKATILDEKGAKTNISHTLYLNINK